MKHTLFPRHRNRILCSLCGMFFLFALFSGSPSFAQSGNPTLIRDTEIENTLKKWSEPVIKAAGLSPDAVKFILVQDNNINAFVAGGPNIFIFTGLITRSESTAEIIGVIAHELGHIRGGHLVRARGAMQNASYESLIGTILGLGAAVLTGEGRLASAIISGSQATAINHYLAFSRIQESSADQSALDSLEKAHISPQGLVSFMEKLKGEELLPAAQQNQYIRTHPLTRDRVQALEAGLSRSPYKEAAYPETWKEEHRRMLAKLTGFITPEQTEWKYDSRDQSIAALYARTIASYRENRTEKALTQMDALLAQEPENPYFLELKGQMLVDFGHVTQALPYYRRSIGLLPGASLIRTAYAHALIESAGEGDAKNLNEAIQHLQRSIKDESRSPRVHRLLATAYGRLGQEPRARLHLSEEALLKREIPYAKRQAEAALSGLEKGSNPWLRAQDILNFIEQNTKETK
ncbi:MAG: peptidase M48 family protein [Alphaproteobacteria bacterium CG_4_9_14_3_um_filter_47_13]|nr:MAG: peptidase M48 family protein [Alphaproteobacteria bacterium CG_4_9_14_3_um_filter_47_13]